MVYILLVCAIGGCVGGCGAYRRYPVSNGEVVVLGSSSVSLESHRHDTPSSLEDIHHLVYWAQIVYINVPTFSARRKVPLARPITQTP